MFNLITTIKELIESVKELILVVQELNITIKNLNNAPPPPFRILNSSNIGGLVI